MYYTYVGIIVHFLNFTHLLRALGFHLEEDETREPLSLHGSQSHTSQSRHSHQVGWVVGWLGGWVGGLVMQYIRTCLYVECYSLVKIVLRYSVLRQLNK